LEKETKWLRNSGLNDTFFASLAKYIRRLSGHTALSWEKVAKVIVTPT